MYVSFHADLAPYGHWFEYGSYGWVWRPYHVHHGWRPYTVGHWVLTDAGWTWISYEPWGWAPYHYGRWFYDAGYGWVWVPGDVWAPAWVSWRYGDGYVGWAPLPPSVTWGGGGVFSADVSIEPTYYSFVPERAFLAPRIATAIVPVGRNAALLGATHTITHYETVNGRVVNHSLERTQVERAVGHHVTPRRVEALHAAAPRHLRTTTAGARGGRERGAEHAATKRFEHGRSDVTARGQGRTGRAMALPRHERGGRAMAPPRHEHAGAHAAAPRHEHGPSRAERGPVERVERAHVHEPARAARGPERQRAPGRVEGRLPAVARHGGGAEHQASRGGPAPMAHGGGGGPHRGSGGGAAQHGGGGPHQPKH